MKKKKGFTLVELLAVMVVLGILSLISVPVIGKLISANKEKLFNAQIETIKDGLKTWGNANALILPENEGDSIIFNLGILKLAGFAEADIMNPNTHLCFSNNMVISITSVKEGYSYYVDEESGLGGTVADCTAPAGSEFLSLIGSSTITVPVGNKYVEPGFLAINANGDTVTNLVTKVIKDNSNAVVSSINTSVTTSSPYTITYTYGSNVFIRTITISS